MNSVVAFVFFELLVIATFNLSFCSGSTYVGCVETEKEALLRFKQDIKDSSNRLASWIAEEDCCKWVDVVCNNFSGHVLELHLKNPLEDTKSTADIEAYERSMLVGKINPSLFDLKHLVFLDLSHNNLEGPIPPSLGALSSLEYLYLSNNKLNGSIPSSLGKLSSLKELYLSNNNLSGPIPSSFGELSSLLAVDISFNKLNGIVSEIHFTNLTSTYYFNAHGNSLHLKVNLDWVPPSQFTSLYLGNCHLGPQFPSWIYSQKALACLDISNSGIVDTIQDRFWKFSSQLRFLNLSHNQIHGEISYIDSNFEHTIFDFSSNNFSGPLPHISSSVTRLDFSNNAFSGPISEFLCWSVSNRMKILNLRNNFLSGELPDCWINWYFLEILYLDNNKFIGNLPISMGTLMFLTSLHLRGNKFSGTIASLKNCTELEVLDLGENYFVGHVPTWIGSFSRMKILDLRSNKFYGLLPLELCHLKVLQILDLASNNLSGTIPRCFNNFDAMTSVDYSTDHEIDHSFDYIGDIADDASLTIKGTGVEYGKTLNLVRIIDLSNNNFSGEIPIEVTSLIALQSLNISHNFLTGRIPDNFGAMRSLEVIDFSVNQLLGEIPKSFSELNFLSYLNLSNNYLTGRIPTSTQLQSLDASSYAGNDLCGPPLPKNCSVSAVPAPDYETGGDNADDEHEVNWFYVSMAFGFVVGFWIMIGPLIVNRRWRYTYCLFLDHLVNKLCCFAK